MPPFHRHPVRPAAGRLAATLFLAATALTACGETPVAPSQADLPLAGPRTVMAASTPATWYMRRPDGAFDAVQFGASDDLPVHSDYDGDGKTDQAVFRPSSGVWYILRSSDLLTLELPFGNGSDRPVPADYDGDGRTDLAVFRPGSEQWWILTTSNGQTGVLNFGDATDVPVPADYDGDGKADLAVYRPSTRQWWIRRSSDATISVGTFGAAGDVPVPADYDGDGKTDLAVWRAGTHQFWILRSSDAVAYPVTWGNGTDVPVPADYDGDEKADIAIFRPSAAQWWILQSSNNTTNLISFGLPGDLPVPGDYQGAGSAQPAVRRDAPPPPAPQTIAFTSVAPAQVELGNTYMVSATGGESGNPVVFSSLTPSVCTVSGSTVSFIGLGTCTVAADQAGNASFEPAPQVTQSIAVGYPFTVVSTGTSNGGVRKIEFTLDGDRGLDVMADGYPAVQQVTCEAPNTPIGAMAPADIAGQGLTYSTKTGTYTLSWKVDKSGWAGTCRALVIRLDDGIDRAIIAQF